MTTPPALLAYNPSPTPVTGLAIRTLAPYWAGDIIIGQGSGSYSGPTQGLSQFNIYPDTADELLASNLATLGIAGMVTDYICVTPGGIGFFIGPSANYPYVYTFRASDLTVLSRFGSNSSIGTGGNSTHIPFPYSVCPLRSGSQEWVLACSYWSLSPGDVNLLNVPTLANTNLGSPAILEKSAVCGMGFTGLPNGSAFILGTPRPADYPSTAALSLYKVTAPSVSLTRLGGILPAQVDATWTHFTIASGVLYDQTDGNVLIMVGTSDAVTNPNYICKLSATDASVMWAVPISQIGSNQDYSFSKSIITNGTFWYIDNIHTYEITTSSGACVTTPRPSLFVHTGGQISEDVTNSVIMYGEWNESSTHPTYLGTYMGVEGNHSPYTGWMRYYPGGTPPPPETTLPKAHAIARAGTFNNSTPLPTQKLTVIPSYLYQEYNDDDDLQAFVAAYNTYAQAFVDWFTSLHLPIYTSDPISGSLLDWVAAGLYGMSRPSIAALLNASGIGPFNTYGFNVLALNQFKRIGATRQETVTDDIFRRILTWHIERRYGKLFTIKWLKFRIVQFLNGVNGIPLDIDNTYQVSVTFGANNQVNINFPKVRVTGVKGFILNTSKNNVRKFNELDVTSVPVPPVNNVAILRAAIQSGALELPFQFTYIVNG